MYLPTPATIKIIDETKKDDCSYMDSSIKMKDDCFCLETRKYLSHFEAIITYIVFTST